MATTNFIHRTIQATREQINAHAQARQQHPWTALGLLGPHLTGLGQPTGWNWNPQQQQRTFQQQQPQQQSPQLALPHQQQSPQAARANATAAATVAPTGGSQLSPGVFNTTIDGAFGARLVHPDSAAQNNELSEAILHLRETENADSGTAKAFNPKIQEFNEFCVCKHPRSLTRHVLNHDSVYNFMWCQCFRNKKPRGGRRQNPEVEVAKFDATEHEEVMSKFKPCDGVNAPQFPSLTDPVGPPTISQCKAVFRRIWNHQLTTRVNGLQWPETWNDRLKTLEKCVQERKPKHDKETFAEKWNGEFAPCAIVQQYDEIENEFWKDSSTTSAHQAICAHLRHRYCVLHLTSGILRCESLHRAELSDFLMVHCPKRGTDVHPMMIMVNQTMFGKTNHGRKLYGRATRHRDVRKCCIGALAFYLICRFFVTKEFEDFTVEDWLDNSKWFSIKLIASTESTDRTKKMKTDSDSHGKHVRKMLKRLRLMCEKMLHLGRNLGAKTLEMLEEDMEEIRRLGDWNPSTFDESYSAKLPLSPIRKLAGPFDDKKFYYPPRGQVHPNDELKRSTPIGKWAHDVCDGVVAATENTAESHNTAVHFLRFLCDMNEVLPQDAAAMQIECPDRAEHPVFSLDCFQSVEFQAFKLQMKNALGHQEEPMDAQFEAVIPGLHQRAQAIHRQTETNSQEIRNVKDLVVEGFQRVNDGMAVLQEDQLHHREELGKTFLSLGAHFCGRPIPHQQSTVQPTKKIQTAPVAVGDGAPNDEAGPADGEDDSNVDDVSNLSEDIAAAMGENCEEDADSISGTATATNSTTDSPVIARLPSPLRRQLPARMENAATQLSRQQIQTVEKAHPPAAAIGPEDPPRISLDAKHTSLSNLWDEWHGEGSYCDPHGGFAGREKIFGEKAHWRKHLRQQQYSRTKRVVQAIQTFTELHKVSTGEAIAVLEEPFKRCNFGAQSFVQCCHLLKTQKQRGRKSKSNDD